MKYGFFDNLHHEYVITDPKTPVKWINYIGTLAFGGFVDQTGGSLLCRNDPALNRITKYLSFLPESDFKGETLYIRIKSGNKYTIYSPFFVPALASLDLFECRVGPGYTRFISEYENLRTEITVFVPLGRQCEIRDIQIFNIGKQDLQVDLIPTVEFSHPDALKQLTNADWVPQTMQCRAFNQTDGAVILVQYPFMYRDTRINYLASNLPVHSYETDRAIFLGDHEYGTWQRPLSLLKSELSNSQAKRGNNVGVLLHALGTIPGGESRRLITQLGQANSLQEALPAIETFRNGTQVDQELIDLKEFWKEYLSKIQVKTPDSMMDHMLNEFNPYQCYITLNWSRYLSLYQSGYGARGIGFRDSSQDIMGVLTSDPEGALQRLRMLLRIQKSDGSAMHQVNPMTMVASEGDSLENESAPHYYSDDHLWIILAICAYLKETGDFTFLKELIPFYDTVQSENSKEKDSILEHMERALAFTHSNLGSHGVPLLGFADWNDTINLRAEAESLFTANLYGKALLEMIELMEFLQVKEKTAAYKTWYEEMREKVNTCAWDGDWYLSYFDADGSPLGSHVNQYGQIHLNGQTWAVISGFAPQDRAESALNEVFSRLNTKFGIKLSTPGFNGYDPIKGGVTTYPPGAKENGGIFLHANPWAMIAETMVGNGDRAYQYYQQINPAMKNDLIEVYECEPYVYPQNILGDEHPQFGLARNSWLTGTASWVYQAATQYILGIRASYSGLLIDPCVPVEWDHYEVVRHFRGSRYEFHIHNPDHHSKGVSKLILDGTPAMNAIIPIFQAGENHSIEVWL